MNIQELATAVQYKLPVKIAILNNNYLGMVRQWQELFYNKNYSATYLSTSPDFVKLAEGLRRGRLAGLQSGRGNAHHKKGACDP